MWRNRLFFPLSNANRWDTHLITRFEFIFRLNTFFVHPHFAFTQNTVNHTFWYAFQLGTQKVIDTLPRFVSGDSNNFYGWSLCFHGGRF
ncbi:Uncharacterised protein [Shigella sonnei]|nr:Uncharacterised protein [Shigella sonnei]